LNQNKGESSTIRDHIDSPSESRLNQSQLLVGSMFGF
jgi:hypothetical protein